MTNEIIAQLDDVLKETTDEAELQELATGGQPKTEEKQPDSPEEDDGDRKSVV